MNKTEHPFEGAWDVISLEYRIGGEWQIETKFGPDEWSIGFLSDCRYLDIYRPDDDRESGIWSFDDSTQIITILYDDSQCTSKHIMDDTTGGVYLYTFDDEPHIRPDRNDIVAHHAHTRQKLVRAFSVKKSLL